MPNRQISSGERKSVLWIALGRQRVGKTTVLNATVQYFREKGCPIEVWNADQQNRSHSHGRNHFDAETPAEGATPIGVPSAAIPETNCPPILPSRIG